MKRALVFVAVLWGAALISAALAEAQPIHDARIMWAAPTSEVVPELNGVASRISEQEIEVRCWADDISDIDRDPDSWGYVFLIRAVVYLSPTACEGALAILHREFAPLWKQALGALVLVHEAYHLKITLPFWRRESESQTECRAIRNLPQILLRMGANQALADALLPWAAAMHYRLATIPDWRDPNFYPYAYPSCRVPGFEFWDS